MLIWDSATATAGHSGFNAGDMIERYAYTPYGQRKVFVPADTNDTFCLTPASMSQRVEIPGGGGTTYAFGLNEFGHQGLMHDESLGIVDNRHRIWIPPLGRFGQTDPIEYPDGLNTYAGYHVMWGGVDPWGLVSEEKFWVAAKAVRRAVYRCRCCPEAHARLGAIFESMHESFLENNDHLKAARESTEDLIKGLKLVDSGNDQMRFLVDTLMTVFPHTFESVDEATMFLEGSKSVSRGLSWVLSMHEAGRAIERGEAMHMTLVFAAEATDKLGSAAGPIAAFYKYYAKSYEAVLDALEEMKFNDGALNRIKEASEMCQRGEPNDCASAALALETVQGIYE